LAGVGLVATTPQATFSAAEFQPITSTVASLTPPQNSPSPKYLVTLSNVQQRMCTAVSYYRLCALAIPSLEVTASTLGLNQLTPTQKAEFHRLFQP
jgi:hypothetical protein